MAKIPSKLKKSIIYWVWLRAYINKSIFGKILSEIEKTIKTFSILDKTFSKNNILLCVLRTHVSKILIYF